MLQKTKKRKKLRHHPQWHTRYPLVRNIHTSVDVPAGATDILQVKGDYHYYHYLCDNFQDIGWGCGFRVLQTLCSWIDSQSVPPSITEMIGMLDDLRDQGVAWNPAHSKTPWIGTYEGCLVIDCAYDVLCRIIHLKSPADFNEHYSVLEAHFLTCGAPVFLGGNMDCFGKCILGICQADGVRQCLILDPHFTGTLRNADEAMEHGCLRWTRTDELLADSFYNLLLPMSRGRLKTHLSSRTMPDTAP